MARDGRGVATMRALVGPQREAKHFRFLVRKAVPGDRVRAVVDGRRGEQVDASVAEYLESSPMRIEPRCRHFGRRQVDGEGCGGCTYQSLSYRHQLTIKERIVRRLFDRKGLDPGIVLPVAGQDEPWCYRNTMEFSFGDTADRAFALGLHPSGYKHEIVNLDECHLQSPYVSALLPAVRAWAQRRGVSPYLNSQDTGFLRTLTIREGKRTGERLVELMTTHAERVELQDGGHSVPARDVARWFADWLSDWSDDRDAEVTSIVWTRKHAERGEPTRWESEPIVGEGVFHEALELPGGVRRQFEIGPRAFFQTNTEQAERLYAEILARTDPEQDGTGVPSNPVGSAVDLYCGTGTISVVLAPFFERVVGVELREEAVVNARRNASFNEVENVEFVQADVAKIPDRIDADSSEDVPAVLQPGSDERPSLVVIDPPRAGLSDHAHDYLQRLDPERVIYVSCHPESFAEDLAELTEVGFRVGDVQPIDMFPQTYHIECVTTLRRGLVGRAEDV